MVWVQPGIDFLPMNKAQCEKLGWDAPDFVYVCGDAYVDHPSFGAAIISRVLQAKGFRVAMLCQPDWTRDTDFLQFGTPRLGFLVSAGNIDSMVAHYTVAKRKRTYDYYSPGGKTGCRPDRAVTVYSKCIRRLFGADMPIILGGLEASLRRFSHYDYWDDRMHPSVLLESGADLLTYGMGENILIRIAQLLDKGVPIQKIRDVRGTVYLCHTGEKTHYDVGGSWSYADVRADKRAYAHAFALQYRNQDSVNGKALTEIYDNDVMLVQNPPMPPLEREELDWVYSLPYMRTYPPCYEKMGGIPAITEVRFSITHNRGCFGGCNFCALAFHQGRTVRSRSVQSVVAEAQLLTTLPDFKGYIHDVGGPTANFRYPSCDKQKTAGVCPNRKCLAPTPCKHLRADHSEYLTLLQKIKALPGIKKVFIRSGLRYDYLLCDQTGAGDAFFKELVRDHVSGQLKVAPEHCSDAVLQDMGKPPIAVFERFKQRYFQLCASMHKEQYLVPYLMSSHPGSTLHDAVVLAQYLKEWGYSPQQVQDFYPTPGTASTVMFYTGIDPFTQKEVYVPRTREEKQLQRALLQFSRPQNAALVRKALHMAHREDLIGFSPHCLVPPAGGKPLQHTVRVARGHDVSVTRRITNASRVSDTAASFGSHQKKTGWAKAKPKRKKPGKNKK